MNRAIKASLEASDRGLSDMLQFHCNLGRVSCYWQTHTDTHYELKVRQRCKTEILRRRWNFVPQTWLASQLNPYYWEKNCLDIFPKKEVKDWLERKITTQRLEFYSRRLWRDDESLSQHGLCPAVDTVPTLLHSVLDVHHVKLWQKEAVSSLLSISAPQLTETPAVQFIILTLSVDLLNKEVMVHTTYQ